MDIANLQISFRDEYAAVIVGCHHFNVAHKLPENELMFVVPFVEPAAKLVQLLVPHALGVQSQTVLEYVFTHDEPLFRSSLQLLPEDGGDEHPSFGVRLGFNIT